MGARVSSLEAGELILWGSMLLEEDRCASEVLNRKYLWISLSRYLCGWVFDSREGSGGRR